MNGKIGATVVFWSLNHKPTKHQVSYMIVRIIVYISSINILLNILLSNEKPNIFNFLVSS